MSNPNSKSWDILKIPMTFTVFVSYSIYRKLFVLGLHTSLVNIYSSSETNISH